MSENAIDGCGDGLFGPGLNSICRSGFDFTLLFEDSILNLLPAACFLLLSPLRIWQLTKRTDRIRRSSIYTGKLIAASILIVTETVALGFAASGRQHLSQVAIPAGVLDLVASLALAALVHFEHFRSVRPSLLSCAFLSVTALLDIARIRSAWMQLSGTGWSAILTASLVAKLMLLALESIEKESLLLPASEKALSKESTSGPFNRALFLWLNRLLKTGWQTALRPDTLPAVDERLDVDVVFRRLHDSWLSVNPARKYALLLALFKAFKLEMLAIVIPRLCLVGLSIAQPFMIGRTVTFLQDTSTASNNTGYGLLGAFILVFISTAVSTAVYQHLGYRVMTMLRGGLIATLYNQMMSLAMESVSESAALSLMGSDAEAFAEYFHATITDSWADLLQLAVAIYLLARMIGAIVIAPVMVAILFTSLSFQVGNMISGRQRTWLEATQRRVNFTTEILGRIRDVKILGLSEHLRMTITGLRDEELQKSKAFRRVSSFKVCLVNSPMFLGQFAVFVAYGIAAHVRGTGQLSVSETVTTLSLVNLLLLPLRNLVYAIPETFSSISCLRRIQEFLAQDAHPERRSINPPSEHESLTANESKPTEGKKHIKDIKLDKLPTRNTGSTYDAYQNTASAISIQHAALDLETPSKTDIENPSNIGNLSIRVSGNGSLTIITGPVGCGKSTLLKSMLGETTSQCGSVALGVSEVAYCSQDPWIVNGSIWENIIGPSDDPFDAEWYKVVVTACALDVDLARLSDGDKTLVGNKGIKLSGGQKQRIALARAIYSKKRIVLLDDVLSGLDNATRSKVFHRVCGRAGLLRRAGCTVVMTAPQTSGQFLAMADSIICLGTNGQVLGHGTFKELRAAGNPVTTLDSDPQAMAGEDDTVDKEPEERDPSNTTNEREVESLQTPDLSVWKFYFTSMGWTNIALLSVFLTVEAGFSAFSYIWITWWSASDDAASSSNPGYWIGAYAAFGVIGTAGLALGTYWTWVVIVPRASKKLHSAILSATMGASMAFLTSTETGVLINRFSQDMRLVDMVLPHGFINTGFNLFSTITQGAIAVAALPYLAPVILFAMAILVLIQRFYLRTSRQLRLLDIEMKAPVFSHFIESLDGLITIRAFGWKPQYLKKSLSLLDSAQRPYYLLLAVQRWLTLVLNLVVAAVAIILVGVGIALRDRVQPGLMGVALVMMTNLGETMAAMIQAWTLLETSLGAISRVKSFAENTPQEEDGSDNTELEVDWPGSGAIEFASVFARHDTAGEPVLKDINLSILPGQRVGICGRTGSGKSSLMMSLLRMVHVESGRITIDGEDITKISPSLLRRRLNCMTQEPFIFGGTVRQNADPLSARSDTDILAALQAVGIRDVIAAKTEAGPPGRSLLDTKLDENFLSHGQRQLFAVARALLRKSSVLLLDEPTSRLDASSHDQVQSAIRSHFRGCTIIMVAHRLDSLLDFDRVVVLDAGRVVEYDNPRVLLADSNSAFAKLFRSGRGS